MLQNKLGITNYSELAKAEELISKKKALLMFRNSFLNSLAPGTYNSLAKIHEYLFFEIYDFAGKLRTVNISKGNFRFAPVLYLESAIKQIESMPQLKYNDIIEKYVEMNIAHPFRKGNGRSTRIWLDLILKHELRQVIDWSTVDKSSYLMAMERSPVNDTELKLLIKNALVTDNSSFEIFMKSIDASYFYEGYDSFMCKHLALLKE